MEPTQLIELLVEDLVHPLAGIRGALSLKKQDLQDHKWQDDQDDYTSQFFAQISNNLY